MDESPVERDLGVVERRVPVTGNGETGGSFVLCQTDRGVWLIEDAEDGFLKDLLQEPALRYQPGQLRDELVTGDRVFSVPFAQRNQARQAIAVGRFRGARRSKVDEQLPRGRFVEEPTPVELSFLQAHLVAGEQLLAWLPSTTRSKPADPVLEGARPPFQFLLTDRQVALVALSPLGDVVLRPLGRQALTVKRPNVGAARVLTAELELAAAMGTGSRFQELAQAPTLDRVERLLNVARLVRSGGSADDAAASRRWLELCLREGSGRAVAIAIMLGCEAEEPSIPHSGDFDTSLVLRELSQSEAPDDALARLWRDWGLSRPAGQALLQAMRVHRTEAEPWALELHRTLHACGGTSGKQRSIAAASREDVRLAQHLLSVGQVEEGRRVLEDRLSTLPNEKRKDVLPPPNADLTEGEGGQAIRIQVYELLAEARSLGGRNDPEVVAELARRQPLVRDRIEALRKVADDELKPRVDVVLDVLDRGGLSAERTGALDAFVGFIGRGSTGEPPPDPRPLSDTLIGEVLRHPAAKDERKLFERIQSALAEVPRPEHDVLRAYCERLSASRSQLAVRALEAACRLLGLEEVQGYVSRGDKGVGFRAYDGEPPFVLVGGQHLDPDSSHSMTEAELRFALGAELAHLRFGHVRVTPDEVWSGTMNTARSGLEMALGFIPALRTSGLADEVASRLISPAMSLAWRASDARKKRRDRDGLRPSPSSGDGLSPLDEQLLVTHRLMQLTADRAGLLLAGDPRAALRAMLLVRRDFHDELPIVEKHGIAKVLGQRSDDGHMAYQNLAVRVSALLRFYLSRDFTRLFAAAYP